MADSMRPSVASVVGLATETKWGQVLQTPHAYGVVEMRSPDGIARTRGIQLLTKLTRLFISPPLSLAALSGIAEEILNEDVISLILLVPVGKTLYLVMRGSGRVYIKRDTKLATLLTSQGALSGDIRSGDTIIAATEGFVSTLTQEDIFGVFDHLSPIEIAEKLTIRLHEKAGGEGGAAIIFKIEEEKQEVAEEDVSVTQGPVRQRTRANIFPHVKAVGRLIHRLRASATLSPKHLIIYAVLALFLISIVLGVRRQMNERTRSNLSGIVAQARHSYDEGMALLELNPVKGRERLTQARDLLAPIVAKKQRSQEAKAVKALYDEVTTNLTRAMHIVEVKPDLFFDMALLKKDAIATDMSLFEQTIGIIDARGSTAFAVGISPKNGTIVGGGVLLSGATHVAAYGDKLYVWTSSGIHQIRLSDQKTVSAIIPSSPEWGTIADLSAFGGNLYLLDTQKGRIWKYVATEKGFSTIFEYLNPDTLPDLSHTTSLAIDGSVWLGGTTGSILRFSAGKENSFSPEGLEVPLGNQLSVYTSVEAKMVYVLDAEHSRVVVFDKDGLYMAQYVWESGFRPTALVVSEEAGKLFLLAEGKIYSTDLK